MKCRHFLSFVLVVLSAFFCGSFITTQNSLALENTYTFNSTSASSQIYCSDSDSNLPSCSEYSFVIFKLSLVSSDSSVFPRLSSRFSYQRSNQSSRLITFNSDFNKFVFTFPSDLVSFGFQDFYNISNASYIQSFSASVTLTSESPFGSSTPSPSGNLDITSNGTYDVTDYASATVNVPAEVIQGDYHDDLVNIQKSIIICGAILLVLYFFYCIYRLIIKNSGVH